MTEMASWVPLRYFNILPVTIFSMGSLTASITGNTTRHRRDAGLAGILKRGGLFTNNFESSMHTRLRL
jgi:hypothetical protein